MVYVIVCLIKGEALNYHENLVTDICIKFNVKRQRLPIHFTIKAPFETDNIDEIEQLTEDFCKKNSSTAIELEDFGRFRESVVFMDLKMSKAAEEVHDKYIDLLKTVPWLEWKRNESKRKIFHCTLVSKIPLGKFKDIFNYVSNFSFNFKTQFNNISILRWDKDKWVTYREYMFKGSITQPTK